MLGSISVMSPGGAMAKFVSPHRTADQSAPEM